MVSMELFDATPRDFSVLDYLFNPNSTQPVSSFDPVPLEVASQVRVGMLAPDRLFLSFPPYQSLCSQSTDHNHFNRS